MESLIKVATIPVILVFMIASSWYFLANGFEGALVTSWVSGTMTAVFGYLGGMAVKAGYKAYKTLRKKK